MDEIFLLSTLELARRIKRGEISPSELTEAHIRRVEEVNPRINAVVVTTFEQAMQEAREAEDKLAKSRDKNDLPPFLGVPCTIKDTFAAKGLPWVAGSYFRRNVIAGEDATIVKRMKDAGFIMLGKTNIPEGAMWIESYNKVYGRTKNPYDTSRGVGGSSGGEGAIIAAGASPAGIGSDIGGSIRYPSFFNGICGHKPTNTLVPQTGHYPPASGQLGKYMTPGPMARRVEDLFPILGVIAGPDGKDKYVREHDFGDPGAVDLKGKRVYYFTETGIAKAGHEVKRAVHLAAQALEHRGCIVEEWRPRGFARGVEIWSAALATQGDKPFEEYIFESADSNYWKEIARALIGKNRVTAPVLGVIFTEKIGLSFMRKRLETTAAMAEGLRDNIESKLGSEGILLSPPFSIPAPKHGQPWLHLNALGFCATFNILQFPGTVVPVRRTSEGIPVGVLLTGARMADHLTLAAAKALEEEFGGWQPAVVV